MSYKKISKIFTLLFILLVAHGSLKAQSLNGSPYSNYGIGDLNSFAFSGPASAGYTSTSLISKRNFTYGNAASNAFMDFTVIKLGATMQNVTQESGSLKGTYTEADMSYITLGFPMMNRDFTTRKYLDSNGKTVHIRKPLRWGLSFGLTPFANTAYGTTFTTDSSFGSFENIFNGEGGVSRVFINNGIRLGEHVAIGYSARFLFGSINDYRVYIFPDSLNIKGQQNHNRLALNGFQHNLSMLYTFSKEYDSTRNRAKYFREKAKKLNHTFGATLTLGSKINSNSTKLVQSMDYSNGTLILEDTLVFNESLRSKVKLPSGFTLGYAVQKGNKWRVAAEYKRENWSQFKWDNSNDSFANSNEYSLGFTLNPDAAEATAEKIEVRFGLRHKQSYLKFQELSGNYSNLTETGITFGLGIPLVGKYYGTEKNLHNILDFGVEYYTRGKKVSGLVKENYINFTLGITFNDYWFKRRKIY